MKVGIDISALNLEHQYRGVGTYTENLIRALQSVQKSDFSVQLIKQGKIPTDCDLVHYPHFDPFFLTLPLRKPKPTVVTIHDVIPLVFPDYYPAGIRGSIKFQIQKFSLKGTMAVITDSENSKRDIVKYLGYPEEKIYVVYLAPGENFKKLETGRWKLETRKKYNLPEKFILYVGDVNYNKNIPGLIRAFYKIKTTIQNLKLVFTGKAFVDENLREVREIIQLIKQLKLEDKIIRLGWISPQDLVKVYNLATVYCQPSFYEGFGLSVLEAMACGCPVVAARTSSLPEICDEAVSWIDPFDPQDIASGLRRLLDSTYPAYQSLVKRGFEQVKKFSWEKTAQETIRVYEEMVV